jgi:hypothetical protein
MTTEQPTTPNPLSVLWDEFAEAAILDAEYGEDIELEPLREAIYDFIRAETAAPLEEALREARQALRQIRDLPSIGTYADRSKARMEIAERALSSPGGGEAVVSAAPSIPGDAP